MSKSKSKNLKRNKLLRLRKKEKALKTESKPFGMDKIESRLKKIGNFKFKNNQNQNIKISEVISEMLKPFLKEAKSFKDKSHVIGIGIASWNLGIIKANMGQKEMEKSMKSFPKEVSEAKEILLHLIDIKCNNYTEYNQFIYDYDFSKMNSKQHNLSVAYEEFSES